MNSQNKQPAFQAHAAKNKIIIHSSLGTNKANDQCRSLCGSNGSQTLTRYNKTVTCDKCINIINSLS
jgi:hypothetical protein